MQANYEAFAPLLGFLGIGLFVAIALAIAVAVIALKGWALWIAVKNNHKIWFVVLLILNTFGILELIYIFLVGKKALHQKDTPREKREEVVANTEDTSL